MSKAIDFPDLVRRCLETDAAMGALEDLDSPEGDAAAAADRAARDELIGALLGLPDGLREDPAVVLPDGTVVSYAHQSDQLAIIPAARVHRGAEEDPR